MRVAKIITYEALTETALVRLTDGFYAVAEGPITTDGPYAWRSQPEANFEAAKRIFADVHAKARSKL